METPKNVLPFRPLGEPKSPVLTPVENSAFHELARQLSARLENENGAPRRRRQPRIRPKRSSNRRHRRRPPRSIEPAGWLAQPEPPPHGHTKRDRMLLDLVPVGVLIYRLDRLVYANGAFLQRMGYADLHALEDAGGLDALYVEPGVSQASSTSDTGTPVTISATQASGEHVPATAIEARLYTISWDDDSALALIFSGAAAPKRRCRRGDRRDAASAGARALARRPRQCRGTRRHPRYHRRRHRDVRRRGQPQFLQPQRRSAVRL